jgi:predicted ATPase
MALKQENYFVITGTPGTGKSSLIRALQRLGHPCVEEPARPIIAAQRACGGNGIPERDPRRFCDLLLEQAVADYERERNNAGPVFFDRGIPDTICYAELFALDSVRFDRTADDYRYNDLVFLTPPWEQIYENDDERKMSFAAAERWSASFAEVYARHGYHVVQLPFDTVERRVRVVLDETTRWAAQRR